MTFRGFEEKDFDVFEIPGLEARMEVLIEQVRPKLELLGQELTPYMTELTGEQMYPHVAKHARRTVNPPKDTWVAWAANKRGYKAYPHFEVGMFSTHVFIVFAIIYESPNKVVFGEQLKSHIDDIPDIVPGDYYWSMNHMSPEGTPQSDTGLETLLEIADKLSRVKKSEVVCGIRLERDDARLRDGQGLLSLIQSTFKQLLPLYKMAFTSADDLAIS